MRIVGLAHFMELAALLATGVYCGLRFTRRTGFGFDWDDPDVCTVAMCIFTLGFTVSSIGLWSVLYAFMSMVFPDYVYWLIGA